LSPPICRMCGQPIDGDPTKVRDDNSHEIVSFHDACWEKYCAEREKRIEQRQIEARIAGAEKRWDSWYCLGNGTNGKQLTHAPKWPWARFDNPEFCERSSRVVRTAVEAWRPKQGSLIVSAQTGKAKTASVVAWLFASRERLMAAIRAGEARDAPSFAFVSGPELSGARRRWKIGEESPLVELAEGVDLLILDELGYEPLCEEIFHVIDLRYRQGVRTVVTTGLRIPEFSQRYGDALLRRLIEPGVLVEDWDT
jgi:hypothetical protein